MGSDSEAVKVLIVEDNEFLRLGITAALERSGCSIIGIAANGREAVEKFVQLRPDVVIMDISMPILDGIEATRLIKQCEQNAKVIVLTSHEGEDEICKALSVGANGYCLKSADIKNLAEGIRTVCAGHLWIDAAAASHMARLCARPNRFEAKPASSAMSELEREVLNSLVRGLSLKEIAAEMDVPIAAAKAQIVNLLNKAGANGADSEDSAAVSELQMTLTKNELANKYEVLSKLGEGGMSSVFKAKHKILGRYVAIKVLNGSNWRDAGIQARFHKEAQITSHLQHANIIGVHDFGINAGQPYLVMDYVDGPTLLQVIERGGPLSESDAITIFKQIADALAYAHSKKVVHRDIKPSNIMLSCEEGQDIVTKIVDFGLANDLDKNITEARLTKLGEVMGSPLYMSPEQCRGLPLDAATDVYSFGCVMYEAVHGVPPFIGKSALETMSQHVCEDAPPVSQNLSQKLRVLIERCLEKDRALRFSSAQELSGELQAIL